MNRSQAIAQIRQARDAAQTYLDALNILRAGYMSGDTDLGDPTVKAQIDVLDKVLAYLADGGAA